MRPPMIGSWQATIDAAKPYQIHGDHYYELLLTLIDEPNGNPSGISVRVPSHAFEADPATGQRVEITFLMGQATGVRVMS
ncbi:MAG: hypothetical protein H7144_16320 [Burkholderiales bacterium]|nr:hypothetical protein [Phycisphaerae bacterium]